ncbi:MAG: thiopeptide-type bacteriocin biosynthesis protein [Deltaproteobacteria bacterium]|nr:thiopeptide-type bacteriocin biosynthesis protein [Deltaproteobacteria bacterium]
MLRANPRQHGLEPGGPWLYLKLYTGTGVADRLLREVIAPIVHEAREQAIIGRWFFLRYRDPVPHLRVRMRGDPRRLCGASCCLEFTQRSRLGSSTNTSTGCRSTATTRSSNAMAAWLESIRGRLSGQNAALALLAAIERDTDPANARWRTALHGIHRLLVDLALAAADRRRVIDELAASFAAEHAVDVTLRRQLGDLHRRERTEILVPDHAVGRRYALDARSAAYPAALAGAHALAAAPGFAASMLHMHANRMFATQARAQEFVVYDLLRRAYATLAALGPDNPLARTRGEHARQNRPRTPNVGSV